MEYFAEDRGGVGEVSFVGSVLWRRFGEGSFSIEPTFGEERVEFVKASEDRVFELRKLVAGDGGFGVFKKFVRAVEEVMVFDVVFYRVDVVDSFSWMVRCEFATGAD